MNEYNLSFFEAIGKCLSEDYFIVGENFKKGCYAKNDNGVIMLYGINEDNKIFHQSLEPLMITEGMLNQKFKTLIVVNTRVLGLD